MRDQLSHHFFRDEFACRCGCGFDTVDSKLVDLLEYIRHEAGHPIKINSGCRCELHNRTINGSVRSQHLIGRAADIWVDQPNKIYNLLDLAYHDRYGIGVYEWGLHVDTRSGGPARWDG